MAKSKKVETERNTTEGKGSLNEAKTNEDFNKKAPKKGDSELEIKKVKK